MSQLTKNLKELEIDIKTNRINIKTFIKTSDSDLTEEDRFAYY